MTGRALTPVLRALALAGFFLATNACSTVQAVEMWGPFRGQIVDVETVQPIAGAAVLVIWWERVDTPIQTNRKFYDARETVTDAEGRFEIPRLSPSFFTFRFFPPQLIYFAPSYVAHGEVVTPPDGQRFVAPTVVQMRRLKTRDELWKKSRGWPSQVPLEKIPQLINAVNAERKMLGFSPIGTAPEKEP
jgi:hypothetical protein